MDQIGNVEGLDDLSIIATVTFIGTKNTVAYVKRSSFMRVSFMAHLFV